MRTVDENGLTSFPFLSKGLRVKSCLILGHTAFLSSVFFILKHLVILAYIFFILITFMKHDLLNIYLTSNQKLFIALNTWRKIKQNKK